MPRKRIIEISVFGASPLFLAMIGKGTNAAPRLLNKKFRIVAHRVLTFWFTEFRPLHFKPGNRQRYRLAERNERYEKWKRKKGLPDLVVSGRARRVSTRTPKIRVTSTLKKQTMQITVRQPIYMFKNRKYGYPLVREVVAHNPQEDAVIVDMIEQELGKELFGDAWKG